MTVCQLCSEASAVKNVILDNGAEVTCCKDCCEWNGGEWNTGVAKQLKLYPEVTFEVE